MSLIVDLHVIALDLKKKLASCTVMIDVMYEESSNINGTFFIKNY
jgi:hypothetical protein